MKYRVIVNGSVFGYFEANTQSSAYDKAETKWDKLYGSESEDNYFDNQTVGVSVFTIEE